VVVALVLVSIALAVTLGILAFGPNRADALEALQGRVHDETKSRQHAESELEKKRKELEEHRGQVGEIKEQLRQAKKKLHEQKESGKEGRDLVKARLDVERQASVQLETVRGELASALTELERLRSESQRPRREAPRALVEAAAPAPVVERAVPAALPVQVVRTIRELSPADKEKMDRLEHQSNKDRARAAELDKELKRLKARLDTQSRVYVVSKGELDLVKDKYRALEKRLNRTLLERDLTKRALLALAKKTGVDAERTELTAEEISNSDRQVEETAAEEAAVIAKAQEAQRAAEAAKEKAADVEATTASAESNGAARNGSSGEHHALRNPNAS
jgi:chromosome segregation ATPase